MYNSCLNGPAQSNPTYCWCLVGEGLQIFDVGVNQPPGALQLVGEVLVGSVSTENTSSARATSAILLQTYRTMSLLIVVQH